MAVDSSHTEVIYLLTKLLTALVGNTDAISVTAKAGKKTTILSVSVPEGPNLGRLIGKQGRTARALRVIVLAAGRKHQTNYQLDINGQQIGDGDVG